MEALAPSEEHGLTTKSRMMWVLLGLMLVEYARGCGLSIGAWLFGPDRETLIAMGALSAERIDRGQIWRIPRSLFLHGDLLHLLFNGLAVWVLGRLGEAIYGAWRLLGILLLCGLAGALLSWSFGAQSTVGMSGAIFGLLGAQIVVGWRRLQEIPDDIGQALRVQLPVWAVLNILLGFIIPMIDNASHIGGLIAGGVMGLIVADRWANIAFRRLRDGIWGGASLGILVVAFVQIGFTL